VLVEFRGEPSRAGIEGIERRHRLRLIASERFQLLGATLMRWRIPDRRSVPAVLRALEADPAVASAQPNHIFALQQGGAGAARAGGSQYVLERLRLSEAHRLSRGERILVAVIDSGIDAGHPELEGVVAASFDAVGGAFKPHAHGTAMAGAIVARAQLTGAAPGARLLGIRAFAPGGKVGAQGTTYHLLRALDWAQAQSARVVNLSFAGPQDPLLSRVLGAARARGMVLIAAAGNAGPKSPALHPAADPNVIAVTATDLEDKLYAAANRGDHICVAAPGVDVLVPTPGGSYDVTSGTSVAAAHVSGLAALLLERDPALAPDAVRRILVASARDLGAGGPDREFGAGLADAWQALVSLAPAPTLTSGEAP